MVLPLRQHKTKQKLSFHPLYGPVYIIMTMLKSQNKNTDFLLILA